MWAPGPGIDAFIENDLAWLNERGARTIVSIAGETVEEYGRLAAKLRSSGGFDAIEVNISCPNVADRGQVFACRAELRLLSWPAVGVRGGASTCVKTHDDA